MKGKNSSTLGILVGAELQRGCHVCSKWLELGFGKRQKTIELDSYFMSRCNGERSLVSMSVLDSHSPEQTALMLVFSKLLSSHFGILTTGTLPSQLDSLQRPSVALFITKIKTTIVCLQEKNK